MDNKELSEILECSVCLERLDHTSKVLPCQHTFCKRCLEEILSMRKELRCPECRILVEEDIDDLPANILLVRILEGLFRKKPLPSNQERVPSTRQKIPKEPCAKVLFDYEPKEQGDLALSKGDIVILVRKVDENWYEGQVKGSQGTLPANYVEVINPLPCLDDSYDDPVAKALYDFDEVQEEDVLTFKQGDIISVTRRIDDNWCEGRLENRCGIFPINFVSFNSVAKAVVESLEVSNSSGEDTPPPSSSASTTQPPPRPAAKSKILSRERGHKRHTIHGCEEREESNISRVPSRHSVEISSSERLEEAYGESSSSRDGNQAAVAVATGSRVSNNRLSDLIDLHGDPRPPSNDTSPVSVHLSQTSEQNGPSSPAPVSNGGSHSRPNSAELGKELYTALYNYKPLKEDEMELKIGESYCVIEKCKDGWFKGYSMTSQKRGVFPGNYVRLASIHNLLTKSRSNSNSNSQAPVPSPRQYSRPAVSSTTSSTRPHYTRSESAPDSNNRRGHNFGNLVVGLETPNEVCERTHRHPEVQNNGMTRPLLPPPPVSKTGGFWKKLKPKKKERSRPPPPPPYTRDVPNGHTQAHLNNPRPVPATPPPPYSSQAPPSRQVYDTYGQRSYHQRQQTVPVWERFRAIIPYPPQSDAELELRVGDIVYVSKKRQDGWYKGTLERNGKTGLFPGCFSENF